MLILTLLESRRKLSGKRTFGIGAASLATHTALIAGAVYATLHAAPSDTHVLMDTTVVLLAASVVMFAIIKPAKQLMGGAK